MIVAKLPPPGPFGRPARPVFPFGDPGTRLTGSGRTAIWLGLKALGLTPGFRILVPAWHCGSEIDAILAAGGVPVLYGLGPALGADPQEIEGLLGRHQASAVYLIHYFGYPQPVAPIRAIAERHGARVIEDLALGLYSTHPDGMPLGQGGDMAVFSLVKTLPLPDGGALWLRDRPVQPLPALAGPPLRRTAAGLKSLVSNRKRKRIRDALAGQDEAARDAWDGAAGFSGPQEARAASLATRALIRLTDHVALARARSRAYCKLHAALPDTERLRPLLAAAPVGACPAFFPLWVLDADRAAAAFVAAGIEPVRFWRRLHPGVALDGYPQILALKRQVIRLPTHRLVDDGVIARIAAVCEALA